MLQSIILGSTLDSWYCSCRELTYSSLPRHSVKLSISPLFSIRYSRHTLYSSMLSTTSMPFTTSLNITFDSSDCLRAEVVTHTLNNREKYSLLSILSSSTRAWPDNKLCLSTSFKDTQHLLSILNDCTLISSSPSFSERLMHSKYKDMDYQYLLWVEQREESLKLMFKYWRVYSTQWCWQIFLALSQLDTFSSTLCSDSPSITQHQISFGENIPSSLMKFRIPDSINALASEQLFLCKERFATYRYSQPCIGLQSPIQKVSFQRKRWKEVWISVWFPSRQYHLSQALRIQKSWFVTGLKQFFLQMLRW